MGKSILTAAYFSGLTLFFSGWETEFHLLLSGLLVMILALTLFGYSLRLENITAKRFIILGSLILFFGHFTEVFIHISMGVSSLNGVYSLIPQILEALGFFFLLLAFKEATK